MMGYIFAVIGLVSITSGITGKTISRYSPLRLPEQVDRAIWVYCGLVFIALGTLVILGRLKI